MQFDCMVLVQCTLDLESLESGADVQRACREFIPFYNHKRDHSSIENQPPMVVYKLAA